MYARKSSESDEKQALSIGSQITEMERLAEKKGIKIVETIQESKSAKDSGGRVGFTSLMEGLMEGRFNAILTWAPDRLSRNAGDLGRLVDLMDQRILVNIQTSGQTFTNTPDEKFLLMILCSQAKLENDNRSKNVKRGLRTKCEMGIRPGCVPLGYELIRGKTFQDPSIIQLDPVRGPLIQKMFQWVAEDGLSGRQVWEYMKEEGLKTKNGKVVTLSMVFRILKETFYYGEFEYPRGSGNWYNGSHEKLITKEMYEVVRTKMKVPPKGRWGRKDFFFNKILKCGACGSGITGEEKTNRHGKHYVYYRCNKVKGKQACTEKYVREEVLCEKTAELVTSLKVEHYQLNKRISEDLQRINRYRPENSPLSSQEYIQGVLKDGTKKEKSDMLRAFKGELLLKNGKINCSRRVCEKIN